MLSSSPGACHRIHDDYQHVRRVVAECAALASDNRVMPVVSADQIVVCAGQRRLLCWPEPVSLIVVTRDVLRAQIRAGGRRRYVERRDRPWSGRPPDDTGCATMATPVLASRQTACVTCRAAVGHAPSPATVAAEVKALAARLPAEQQHSVGKGGPCPIWRSKRSTRRIVGSMSTSTVRRWLAADALKPWQHRS